MMRIHGSTLSHPFRADQRGTLAVVSEASAIIKESLQSIVETRQGEDKMMPGYGIPDFVFDVVDAGFAARIAYFVQQQIEYWEPLVKDVRVRPAERLGKENPLYRFEVLAEPHRVYITIEYTERQTNTRRNLTLAVI